MVLNDFFNSKIASITNAALVISAASLSSRLLGVVRDRLLVSTFGVGDQLDAYYASFQIPNILYNLLIMGTLSAAFIPVFTKVWQKNPARAWEVTNSILHLTVVVMGLLSLLALVLSRPLTALVAHGFSGEKFELAVQLSRWMLLSPIFFSMSAVFASALNARRSFVPLAFAPLVYNLSIIVGILLSPALGGIYAVVWAVVIGALLHAFVEWIFLRADGYRFGLRVNYRDEAVSQIGKLFVPRIFGVDVSQISLLVGTIIGSSFAGGSVAIFNLAVNIQSVPIGIIAVPFAVAAFPVLTESIAQKDRERFVATLSFTIRNMIFLLIPLTILTIILRAQIIRLIIGTRLLSWPETRLAAAALGIFALSFIFQGVTPLFSRAFYALEDTVRPVLTSFACIVANVLATILFSSFLSVHTPLVEAMIAFLRLDVDMDVRVLALPIGFVLASMINALVLGAWLRYREGPLGFKSIMITSAQTLVASCASGLAAYGTLQLMVPIVDPRTPFMGILGQLAVSTVIALVVYALCSLLLKSREMWQFIHSLERRMISVIGPVDLTGIKEM